MDFKDKHGKKAACKMSCIPVKPCGLPGKELVLVVVYEIYQDKSFSEYDAILNSDLYGILASVLLKHGKISYIKEFIESVN